jgi:hypothetical protein
MDREIAGPWMFGPGDHVVEPGTRVELFRGRLIWIPPSRPGRADIMSRANKVIGCHEADGYATSIDLLTRRSYDNDFATAICVRHAGVDQGPGPATGHRYLEELAFEIFFEQPREYACDRAHDVVEYGVRRMFGIFGTERWPGSEDDGVADYSVAEWSAERNDWIPLAPDHVITDPCLFPDFPAVALVDAPASDNAAFRALRARYNPVLEEYSTQARRRAYHHDVCLAVGRKAPFRHSQAARDHSRREPAGAHRRMRGPRYTRALAPARAQDRQRRRAAGLSPRRATPAWLARCPRPPWRHRRSSAVSGRDGPRVRCRADVAVPGPSRWTRAVTPASSRARRACPRMAGPPRGRTAGRRARARRQT